MWRTFNGIIGYRYGIPHLVNDEDPWVADVLEDFDPKMYAELQEWTKKGANVYEVKEKLMKISSMDRSTPLVIPDGCSIMWKAANDKVSDSISKYGMIEAISVEEALDRLEPKAGAGFSFPGKMKGDVLPEILKKAKNMIAVLKDGRKVDVIPCRVATRGHLRLKTSDKRRLIFVYPAEVAVIEQMFVGPIYDKMKADPNGFLYFGKDVIARLAQDSFASYQSGMHSIQVDFSSFDTTVREDMIEHAFSMVEDIIDFDHFDGFKVSRSQSVRWRRVFEFVKEYFKHTPVMDPSGDFVWINGAIPSGSGFTQLIGSIVSSLAVIYTAGVTGCGVRDSRTLGDDVKLIIAQRPVLETWGNIIERVFGMQLNLKKTKVKSARVVGSGFLSYKFKNGLLYRDTFELFNLALHPEVEVKELSVSLGRMVAYLFLGGANDIKFIDFFRNYQRGYDLSEVKIVFPKELNSKRSYAGMHFPLKDNLGLYTMEEFATKLTSFST